MYHGILVDPAFTNLEFLHRLKLFTKRKSSSNDWYLLGVEIADDELSQIIADVQFNMSPISLTILIFTMMKKK